MRKVSEIQNIDIKNVGAAFKEDLPKLYTDNEPMIDYVKAGKVLAIDIGGSFIKIALVNIKSKNTFDVSLKLHEKIAEDIKKSKTSLFDYVASKIISIVVENSYWFDNDVNIAIALSHPLKTNSNKKYIRSFSKGWDLSKYFNKDLVSLFQKSIDQKVEEYLLTTNGIPSLKDKINQINVKSVVNDTISAHMSHPSADIAIVLGTGFAISHKAENTIEIIEAGMFYHKSLNRDTIDQKIFSNFEPLNVSNVEKMISGKYILKNVFLRNHNDYEIKDIIKKIPRDLNPEDFKNNEYFISLLQRAGKIIGSMVLAISPPVDKISILIEGSVIKSNKELRDSIENTVNKKITWISVDYSVLVGVSKIALSYD